jgi:hypothetical protein
MNKKGINQYKRNDNINKNELEYLYTVKKLSIKMISNIYKSISVNYP